MLMVFDCVSGVWRSSRLILYTQCNKTLASGLSLGIRACRRIYHLLFSAHCPAIKRYPPECSDYIQTD
jgi:hypothetical protein